MTPLTLILTVAAACCGIGMAAESANEFAMNVMNSRHVKAVSVVQDVASGKLVISAASQPESLDPNTPVLPLSLSKVFLAAAWWDHFPEARVPEIDVDVAELLVTGSDSLGRRLAVALRQRVGTAQAMADLKRYGFDGAATADLATLGDADWSSALSIGESHMSTTALHVSSFLREVANGSGVVQPATARQLTSAMIEAVTRGSAKPIAGILSDTGWCIGGKTGTGGRQGKPLEEQDGWFAGLIFDPQRKARFTVATFVSGGGPGAEHAAHISAEVARYVIRNASR